MAKWNILYNVGDKLSNVTDISCLLCCLVYKLTVLFERAMVLRLLKRMEFQNFSFVNMSASHVNQIICRLSLEI